MIGIVYKIIGIGVIILSAYYIVKGIQYIVKVLKN